MLQSNKLLAFTFTLLALSSTATAQRVQSNPCGFSLKLLPGWRISRTHNHDVKCWYTLEGRKRGSCSMLVRTLESDFASAAQEAGFEQNGSDWVINETWGETIKANSLAGPRWKGITADHITRETDAVTGEVTGVHTWVAVLNDGKRRSAIIEAFDCQDKQFDAIMRSFRFIARK